MTINEKYKTLKEMEKGRKAADICKEHPSLSKQTLSNWKKNKDKVYDSEFVFAQGMNFGLIKVLLRSRVNMCERHPSGRS